MDLMLKRFPEVFWTESIWLPSGTKWIDVANRPGQKILYPDSSDFLYQINFVLIILFVRYTFEKYCYEPLGHALGITYRRRRSVPDIPLLESQYRKSSQIKDVSALAKQVDMSVLQIKRWWRLRRNMNKPTKMTKFCQHAWRATYFGSNYLVGLYILWDKDYFWDLDKCIIGYPHQGVTNDVWWFYMINTASSWAAIISVFREARRSDFVSMIVHHLATVLLLSISWISSCYRIGTVLLTLLDGAEAILEVVKALKLTKYEYLCEWIFYLFVLAWCYTRIYIFPFHILYSAIIKAHQMIPTFIVYYVMITLLLLLFVLQVYWTTLIFQIIYRYLAYGVRRDIRSSESESSDYQILDADVVNDFNDRRDTRKKKTIKVSTSN